MQMLVGRSIQGVGGGGIIALSEVIITDLVPLRYRGQYFGIFSAMWSIGSVTGPILGGGFAQNVTWVSRLRSFARFPEYIMFNLANNLLALDILYQFSVHRCWNYIRHTFLNTPTRTKLPFRKATTN